MDGVNVVARVAHVQAVPLSSFEVERSGNYRLSHRIGDAVDRPTIETFFGGVVFRKSHLKCIVGRRSACARLRKARIVPFERWRSDPRWFAGLSGVFDYDAHAMAAVVVIQVPQNPDAGMLHFHDGGNAFGCSEP